MSRKAKKPRKRGKRRVGRVEERRVTASAERVTESVATVEVIATETTAEPTAEVAVVENMGADHQMNTVEVNEAQLIAEANAAVTSAPTDELQPQGDAPQGEGERAATPEEIQKGYEVLFTGVVGWGANTFAPAWAVTAEETNKLSAALAGACVLWFPDQPIPPKYLALLAVVAVSAEIVQARRDPQTGMLKPLHANAVKTSKPTQTEAA